MDSNQELEQRLARLEEKAAAQREKLLLQTADLLALRAAIVSMTPLISSSSAAQYAAVKARSLDRLTNYLLAGEMGDEMAVEATTSLEGLFYEIDVAQNEAGQLPPAIS